MLITETHQPFGARGNVAYFFGKTRISTSKTIWIRLLLRSGDIPMISLVAYNAMLIIATVVGSIVKTRSLPESSDVAPKHVNVFHGRPDAPCGLNVRL